VRSEEQKGSVFSVILKNQDKSLISEEEEDDADDDDPQDGNEHDEHEEEAWAIPHDKSIHLTE